MCIGRFVFIFQSSHRVMDVHWKICLHIPIKSPSHGCALEDLPSYSNQVTESWMCIGRFAFIFQSSHQVMVCIGRFCLHIPIKSPSHGVHWRICLHIPIKSPSHGCALEDLPSYSNQVTESWMCIGRFAFIFQSSHQVMVCIGRFVVFWY